VLPLEDFAIDAGQLKFNDIGARSGLSRQRAYRYDSFQFDNASNRSLTHYSANNTKVPAEILAAKDGAYIGCTLTALDAPHRSVTVYFVRRPDNWVPVGLERTSSQMAN
jgi:hypothetical protein